MTIRIHALRTVLPAVLLVVATTRASHTQVVSADSAALHASVQELRSARGTWSVVTEFLNPDGTLARRVTGRYRFDWALEDRILTGMSEIPEQRTASGILFFIAPGRRVIEMLSVGADGMVWTMTGPLGGDTRTTQPFKTQGGGEARLRFTRFNVKDSSFESRMEYSEDGGKTWLPGNHQLFTRQP